MNATFQQHTEAFVMWLLKRFPTLASEMGIRTWDDRLADFSIDAITETERELARHLGAFQAYCPEDFSVDGQVDLSLVVQFIHNLLREHRYTAPYLRNPGYYLNEAMNGVFSLILKGSTPWAERQEHILARISATPRILTQAKENLVPEIVPPVWAEIALEQAEMAPSLFNTIIPSLADSPQAAEKLACAGKTASEAVHQFAVYLRTIVLPRAAGDFAVGESLFNKMLSEDHMVNYDSQELLSVGKRLFIETKQEMTELARQIDTAKTAEKLLEEAKCNHPPAGGVLDAYRAAMAAARDFVETNRIATLPEDESLDIIETPFFLRPLIPFAAYIPPGIFERNFHGLFMVTTPAPDTPPQLLSLALRNHHYAKLPVTALHEAYPGHHLQLVRAARDGSTARKLGILLSTLFIEGWAFYCEEMMEREGFIREPIQRLGRLHDQLWRAARIILDVGLHCGGMSITEATHFLVDQCQLSEVNASAEVRRYTLSPTQPQSYLMGKMELVDIMKELKQQRPNATLRELHDAMLDCGALPPRLLRKLLFQQ